MAGITGHIRPRLARQAIIVLAADHGVAVEGVSAYPQEVTAQMVQNFLHGGAAINVLARQVGARVVGADLGVATELPDHPDLVRKNIGWGTRNKAQGPAMPVEEALAVLDEMATFGDTRVSQKEEPTTARLCSSLASRLG